MKIVDLLHINYNNFKEEYTHLEERLPKAEEELRSEEERLRKEGIDYYFHPNNYTCYTYNTLKKEIANIERDIPKLKNNLIKINEVLNNSERLISLNRNELNDFSYNKIILDIYKSASGDSHSNMDGSIKGSMNGGSFLGFGSVSGCMNGDINGKLSTNYEEYIVVKYKYNLDFEIEEFLFDINDYLK